MDDSPPPPASGQADEPPHSFIGRDLPTALTAVLVLVVVALGVFAAARGWIPTGDDAFISLRTRHIFSAHPILLNNASSAGPSSGSQYNHPGAFPLTLLAPVTLVGGPGSLPIATALVNAAWIAAISVMVRRIGGRSLQLGALVVVAALVWSMGGAFLVDPWNPNYGIWPVAALVVAAWGTRRGHPGMLAVAVGAASVAFQTHLSLTVLSASVAAWAFIGWVQSRWAARRAGGGDQPAAHPDTVPSDQAARERGRGRGRERNVRVAPNRERERGHVRALVIAVAVGLVANAQMLVDQVAGSGNLGKILRGTGFKEATVSLRQVAGVVASKAALPPWWFRGSWARPVLLDELPSTAWTLVGVLIVAVLTFGAVFAVRGRAPAVSSLFGVLAVAAIPATLVATKFPLRIGIPLPYFRWVWPLAAIWTGAVLAAAAVALSRRRTTTTAAQRAGGARRNPLDPRRTTTTTAAAGMVLLLAALTFVPVPADLSPNPTWAQDIARPFSAAAVRATTDARPVVVDQSIQEAALWVIPALMDQLDAAGIDVRADDRILVQQTADRYRATGRERWHLAVRGGLQIDDAPNGARELARHDALTASERAELDRLVTELAPALARPNAVRLTTVGTNETDAADLRHLTTGELPPRELLGSVPFHNALERDAVEVPDVNQRDLRRASELGARDGGRSIALYLYETP